MSNSDYTLSNIHVLQALYGGMQLFYGFGTYDFEELFSCIIQKADSGYVAAGVVGYPAIEGRHDAR